MSDSQHNPRLTATIVNDVENFLRIAIEGPVPSIGQLICALDKLAVAYHEGTGLQFVDADVEPPDNDYKTTYDQLCQRFPGLGLYAMCDPLNVGTSEVLTGDAIDDLADIVTDLREVVWRCDNINVENAIWHFCNLYQIHWGRHLRELSLYLHTKQF